MTMHTFAVYVEDRPGVLNRVASLFRRRGFNIISLAVGHSETPGVSRMTVVVQTDAGGAQRIEAHLYKLIHVIRVEDITNRPAVVRDLALIKVSADREHRPSLMQLAEVFGARVVDVAPESHRDRDGGIGSQDRRPARRAASVRRARDGAHRPRRDGARRGQRTPAHGRPRPGGRAYPEAEARLWSRLVRC